MIVFFAGFYQNSNYYSDDSDSKKSYSHNSHIAYSLKMRMAIRKQIIDANTPVRNSRVEMGRSVIYLPKTTPPKIRQPKFKNIFDKVSF